MLPNLVIDLRCLQDPNYAERGIGNHARCIVATAPARFIGIFDPALPPLPPDVAELAAVLSPHAYLPGLTPGSVFLNPSPMTPGQNFVARLLLDKNIFKAACVHDFIPYDDQPRYLTHPVNRLDYFGAMAWLRRYDLLLANSAPTAARARELFGDVPMAVTGVALPPWAAALTPGAPKHILMVGGDDTRKNPEILAYAHAGSKTLKSIPLVISGSCTPATAARLRGITNLTLPSRVSDQQLRELYQNALCVVAPSWAEGFSLPLIEASAAGVPVIASDIAAHRALLPDPAHRFSPDDSAGLARMLEAIAASPKHPAAIITAQAGIWQNFTREAVAARIWSALAPKKPAVMRREKPRIAMLTPLPPQKSGISDYSAAMAAALARHARVTLLSGDAVSPLTYCNRNYHRVVSVTGNSHLHSAIYECAVRYGSAVLCHDSRLLGLVGVKGQEHAARIASRELRRTVTEHEIALWSADETLREASFLGELAAAARPLIFHAPQSVALVKNRFGVDAKFLPFAIQRQFSPKILALSKTAARQALGLPEDEILIFSFGFLTTNKAIPIALRAFAALRETARCRLIFVGEVQNSLDLFQKTAEELGIVKFVTLGTGFHAEAIYQHYFAAADAALQLREGGPGNISGALQDCIAAGLPTVANRDLADNIFAPSYVRRVSDALDAAEIATSLAETLSAPVAVTDEQRAYCETHSMARYAMKFLQALGL